MSNIEYDIYSPIVDQNPNKFYDSNETVLRLRALTRVNPYMAANPSALMALAMSDVPTDRLIDQGAAMYGMQAADTMREQLEGMSAPQQRSVFNQLSPAQQQTLTQQGYATPKRDEDAWYETITNPVGNVVGSVLGTASTVIEKTPIGEVLDGLTWMGDQLVARPYRAIRTMDDDAQLAALLGAVVAVGAVIAAPVTGGLSLGALAAGVGTMATIGTIATSAAVGGSVAALAYSTAQTNPSDWFNAWQEAGNGERTFDRAAQEKADALLGDPRLLNAARDIAFVMPEGYSLGELVRDMADQQDVLIDTQIRELAEVAGRFAQEGTLEYRKVFEGLYTLIQQPAFQEAVATLQNGKISIGRDFADLLQFAPGSRGHSLVSGSIDGTLLFAADPTLLLSAATKTASFMRRGISNLLDGQEAVDRFRKIVVNNKKVYALHEKIAEAVNANDWLGLKRWAPGTAGLYNDLVAHKSLLSRQGALGDDGVYTIEHFHEFITDRMQLKPLLEGYGTARTMKHGVVLQGIGVRNQVWQKGIAAPVRAFTTGLVEPKMEAKLLDLIEETPEAAAVLPEILFPTKLDVAGRRQLEKLRMTIRDVDNQWEALTPADKNLMTADAVAQGLRDSREMLMPDFTKIVDEFRMLTGVDARTVDEITPELLAEFALRNEDYAWSRVAHRAGRQIGKRVLGARTLGSFIEKISTMIPEGTAISLSGAGGPREIERFVDLSSLMGMPTWMRDEYARMIINQPTVGMRATAMQSFLDTMLTVGGIRTTPEGIDFADKFLDRVHQAYAAGGLDTVKLFGRTSRQAIYLSEMADAIVMPSLKDIRRAMQGNYIAKLVGLTDAPLIEAVQTKFWKPSVLLRFGFIPRAAGEEMLNFMLRTSEHKLLQDLGARSSQRYKIWSELQEKLAKNPNMRLSDIQEQILQQGPLPSAVRLVQRMGARGKFERPANYVLERFSSYYQEFLETGFGADFALDTALTRASGVPFKVSPTLDFRKMVPVYWDNLSKSGQARLSTTIVADSLMFGSPYSWRRMAAGGVHDDLIEAADVWYSSHGTTIMREVGASVMGPYDPANTTNDVMRIGIEQDANGNIEYAYFQSVKGQRELKTAGDGYFNNALHHQAVRPVEDVVQQEALPKYVARIVPADVEGITPTQVAQIVEDLSSSDNDIVRALVPVLLTDPKIVDYDYYLATVEALPNQYQYLKELLLVANRRDSIDVDQTITALTRAWLRAPRKSETAKALRNARDVLMQASESINTVRTAPLATRNWLNTLVATSDAQTAERIRTLGSSYFYRTWDDAVDDMAAELSTILMRPYNQKQLGHFQALNLAEGDIAREFQQLPLQEGMVTTWLPAPATQRMRRPLTYLELRQGAANRALLDDNEELVTKWLDAYADGIGVNVYMSDKAVADEIARALGNINRGSISGANVNSVAMAVDLDATILRPVASQQGVLPGQQPTRVLHADKNDRPVLWSTDSEVNLSIRHPDAQLGESVDQISRRMVERARQVWTRGNREYLRPKTRLLENGDVESLVFRSEGRRAAKMKHSPLELSKVDPTENIYDKGQYFNNRGEAIEFGDERYFERSMTNGQGDVVWEYVGPILLDAVDDFKGSPRYMRRPGKDRVAFMTDQGPAYQRADTGLVRVYRSKPEHINDVTGGLVNMIDSEVFRVEKLGKWDSFVRYGFDRVIGPAIDALARRPMAFHFFSQRYMQTKSMQSWLRDPNLVDWVDNLLFKRLSQADRDGVQQLAEYGRTLAQLDNPAVQSAKWPTRHSIGWLRGHTSEELTELIKQGYDRVDWLKGQGQMDDLLAEATTRQLKALEARGYDEIVNALPDDSSVDDVLRYFRDIFTSDVLKDEKKLWRAISNLQKGNDEEIGVELFASFTKADANLLAMAERNALYTAFEAGEAAAVAAINDMIPFLDSHKFKTQFAEYGKGFLPFWYAEENFMKRWARSLNQMGPEIIRKAQLGYMGLKTAGVVRTDPSGRDWFVWPGSNLLQEAINKIPGMPDLPAGVLFETPTDMMLPGMNTRVGTPQFGPLVSMPLDFLVMLAPEAASMERQILGDIGASRNAFEQLIPAPLAKTMNALMAEDGDQRLASAMMSAIAQLEANGNGLKENATPGETDEFLRDVRNHARIVLISQALGGWFAPGPLSTLNPGEDADLLTLGVENPSQVLGSMYQDLVRNLGIEAGTIKYLETVPMAELGDIVNPLAYTTGKSESQSGAPLPATEIAQSFYDSNDAYMSEMPNAGPWMLPNDPNIKSAHSQYAYDQQTINGLRKRKTPAEFLDQLKFKEGASEYFRERKRYRDDVEQARASNNRQQVTQINQKWAAYSATYKATHPKFAEMLDSSDARQRRARVISEMRIAINDPESPLYYPQVTHGTQLREMISAFDLYLTDKATLSQDKSALGRRAVEQLKGDFETYMDNMATQMPILASFWLGVLRPESELD